MFAPLRPPRVGGAKGVTIEAGIACLTINRFRGSV